MSVVRANPIPPGVYWIDVWRPSAGKPQQPNGEPAWLRWFGANTGRVAMLREEQFDSVRDASRTFRVFRVFGKTTDFPFRELGFPSVAEHDEIESKDVAHNLPTEFGDIFGPLFQTPATLLVVGVLMYLYFQKK